MYLKEVAEGHSQVQTHLSECEHFSQAKIDWFETLKKSFSDFDFLIYKCLLIKNHKRTVKNQLFKSKKIYTLKAF